MLKKPVVILFSGLAGTGKTTSCLMIQDLIKKDGLFLDVFDKNNLYHFATGVKSIAQESFGWDLNKDSKGRLLLQDVGRTGRSYNKDIWVNICLESINEDVMRMLTVCALIDDWRFPNELDVMKLQKHLDVFTVRIYAPNREILLGTDAYNDVSETSLSHKPEDYDYFVNNTGTFDDLKFQLIGILNDISEKVEKFGDD